MNIITGAFELVTKFLIYIRQIYIYGKLCCALISNLCYENKIVKINFTTVKIFVSDKNQIKNTENGKFYS